jgi:branched-chain amino acid transport system substrate-binding protein
MDLSMRGQRRRLVLPVAAVAAALWIVPAEAAAGHQASKKGGVPASAIAVAAKYVGAKSTGQAKASTPITIGYVNSQGGVPSFPDTTAGADTAVEFVNHDLDGIDGHPLKLVSCFSATSVAQTQTCGERMVDNSKIPAVIQGNVVFGDLTGSINARKPVLGGSPVDPADYYAANTYFTQEAFNTAGPTIADYIVTHIHAKNVAVLADAPNAGTGVSSGVTSTLAKLGATGTVAMLPTNGSNYTGPVVASGAEHAGAIAVLVASTAECIAVANTLKQLQITVPVVSSGACNDPQAVGGALGDLPKWTYDNTLDCTCMASESPDVGTFLDAQKTFPEPQAGAASEQGFSLVMVMTRLLNQVGASKATSANLKAAMKSFRGPVFVGAPTLAFGTIPKESAVGTISQRFYTYLGNGHWKDATGGKWISPPKS